MGWVLSPHAQAALISPIPKRYPRTAPNANYSPRGRGEGWAGPLANQRSGNPEGAGFLETTWLLPPELAVLVLSLDPSEGPGVRSRGSERVPVPGEDRTVTISPEEAPAYKQTFPAPESGGTGSPAGPRRPIVSQRVAPVPIPSLGFQKPVKETVAPRNPGFQGQSGKGTAPYK